MQILSRLYCFEIPRRDLSIKPPRGLFISRPFGRMGVGGGSSFNVEMMIVSVIIQRGKAQVQDVFGYAGKDQNQIRISSCK